MSEQQTSVEKESFAALLEESMGSQNDLVGQVIEGCVVSIENDFALIDVGLKSEGRVLLKEFAPPGQKAELSVGDTVEVFLERMENKNGEAVLSREKARREEAWTQLEKAFDKTERVSKNDWLFQNDHFACVIYNAVHPKREERMPPNYHQVQMRAPSST